MIQIALLLIIIIFAFIAPKEKVLLTTLFFLPFHFLIKSIFNTYTGSSDPISSWKEIVFLILLLRLCYEYFKGEIKFNKRYPILIISSYIILSLFLFLTADNFGDALTSFKNLSFPLICFFIIVNIKFFNFNQYSLFRILVISSIFVDVIAHLQKYFFKTEFAVLFNLIDTYAPNGDIIYNQTANTIAGFDRMYGCFAGPNELGLYIAIILIGTVVFLLEKGLSKFNTIILIIAFFFGLSTLIQTYSRVSWFLFIAASLFYLILKKKKLKLILFAAIVAASLAVLIAIALPDATEIFIDSITLKEASAGTRSSNFSDGLQKILERPFGYGLGTIQYSSSLPRQWPTEIFWWLVLGENGILIGGLLMGIYIYSALKPFKFKYHINIFTNFASTIMIIAIIAGFGSVVLFEPVIQVYLWSFLGLGYNIYLAKR
jgi:hypothetical protein